MCENKLMEKVDAKNAIDMLVVAEMYKANDLKRVAKDIIMEKGMIISIYSYTRFC